MRARAILSSYLPRSLALSRFPTKSFISPAYKNFSRNSFVSPTYAKTGGYTPPKMSARRHFLYLFSQSLLSALLLFNHMRTLSFSVSNLSLVPPAASALLPQKQGVHPLWSNQSHTLPMKVRSFLFVVSCRLSTVDCRLSSFTSSTSFTSFTSFFHSPRIHKAVTGASPNVVRGLSQWRPVRGPTQTPCLSLSHRVRYTSTNAHRPARSLHETCTDH